MKQVHCLLKEKTVSFSNGTQQFYEENTKNINKNASLSNQTSPYLPTIFELDSNKLKQEFKQDCDYNLKLNDDWNSVREDLFATIESRLKNILLINEKSSREKFNEIDKVKQEANYKSFINKTLKDYDDQINMVDLLKNNPKYMCSKLNNCSSNSGSYKSQLVDEMQNKKCHCGRWIENTRRFTDNELLNFGCDKKKIFKLPKIKKKKKRKPIYF